MDEWIITQNCSFAKLVPHLVLEHHIGIQIEPSLIGAHIIGTFFVTVQSFL